MTGSDKNKLASARFMLPLFFLLITLGGFAYNSSAPPAIRSLRATCQNPKLWPNHNLENEISCPLDPDSNTVSIFWNNENIPEASHLIAGLVAKLNVFLIEPVHFGQIQIDSTLVTLDKKTHKVVNKKFTKFSKYYYLKFNDKIELSQEVAILSTPIHPDHYYRFEINDLRVYLNRYEFRYKLEYFKNKKFLVNTLFNATTVAPFDRVRIFQRPTFCILIFLILYFSYRLLTHDNSKLLDPLVWMVFLCSCSAALYLYPGQLPFIEPIHNYVQFFFFFATAIDCTIFGKALPKPLNSLLPFLATFFSFVAVGFSLLGVRDTHKEPFPIVRDSRGDLFVTFQDNLKIIVKVKFIMHLIVLVFGLFRSKAIQKTFIHLVPALLVTSTWTRLLAKDYLMYFEDTTNPAGIFMDFVYVPLCILVLQLVVLDSSKSYLGMAPADESLPLYQVWPFSIVWEISRKKIGLPAKTDN